MTPLTHTATGTARTAHPTERIWQVLAQGMAETRDTAGSLAGRLNTAGTADTVGKESVLSLTHNPSQLH